MDDFILTEQETAGGKAPETEFFLATVKTWNNSAGVTFTIDGESTPVNRGYKMMLMCRPLHTGARVVVMKQSGTYIVLGEVSNPNSWQSLPDLASGASLADVISKVNALLAWLRTQGILWTS